LGEERVLVKFFRVKPVVFDLPDELITDGCGLQRISFCNQ